MDASFRLFPEQASSEAGRVDALYLFVLLVVSFFTLLIASLILFFAVHYRRRNAVERVISKENLSLEVTWCLVPLALTMIMFVWGARLFVELRQPPAEADEIQVVGKQWMWKLQHSGGKREINELHLPVGRTVKLSMISEDVIHSFFVPNFRVKQDVLPGRYTTMWFKPTKAGTYHLFCAEYCGTSHSQMRGKVVVMESSEFANWLSGQATSQASEVSGRQLFEQFRCNTCHEGSTPRGPPLQGIFGQDVRLADGQVIKADEDYLRESILDPQARVVAGYQPLMPTFKGQIGEEGLLQIIAYLKSLAASGGPTDKPSKSQTNNVQERP